MCSMFSAPVLYAGSLLDILKERLMLPASRYGVLDEATIATVLREVLKGLDYFHSRGQIHRCVLPPPPPPPPSLTCLSQQPLSRARRLRPRLRACTLTRVLQVLHSPADAASASLLCRARCTQRTQVTQTTTRRSASTR